MKAKLSIALLLILTTLLVSTASAGFIFPNDLDSGYYLTSNYHGESVPPGATVTMTAESTNTRVRSVQFLWFAPDGTLARVSDRIPVWTNGSTLTNDEGTFTIYFAEDNYIPNVPGHWGVVAVFFGEGGIILCRHNVILAIRFTFFNVVPEIQVAGTAGAAGIMLLGFGLFAMKKRKEKAAL
jgi:hypothetical protein